MNSIKFLFLALLVLGGFVGCEKKITTELQDIHWDRDMCERCKMVVSDRTHTVQVINPNTAQHYMFDDIGCAILWFEDENISWSNQAKIWITDFTSGKWIDAKIAYYESANITPMAYGFAAHESLGTVQEKNNSIDFKMMSQKIIKIEELKNRKNY